eukprot:c19498_g1_i5.p1 GENE.c19498_g1_i5~~c19498_g1_i5.p1  ORF type:complete len:308 (+),score=68.52 c19498_g1_i5:41-964(+)
MSGAVVPASHATNLELQPDSDTNTDTDSDAPDSEQAKAIHDAFAAELRELLQSDEDRDELSANINEVLDKDGSTMLIKASDAGAVDSVEILIGLGADIHQADHSGCTPIFHAARGRHLEVVRTLIKHGADVNVATARTIEMQWHFFIERENRTPLSIAADVNDYAIVEFLLQNGARAERTEDLWTPAFDAVWNKNTKMLNLLIEHGVDLEFRNQIGETVLFDAARKDLDTMACLLEHGVDINPRNEEGQTPLISAASEGEVDSVPMLLDYGARVDIATNDGETAFHVAGKKVRRLLSEVLSHTTTRF